MRMYLGFEEHDGYLVTPVRKGVILYDLPNDNNTEERYGVCLECTADKTEIVLWDDYSIEEVKNSVKRPNKICKLGICIDEQDMMPFEKAGELIRADPNSLEAKLTHTTLALLFVEISLTATLLKESLDCIDKRYADFLVDY